MSQLPAQYESTNGKRILAGQVENTDLRSQPVKAINNNFVAQSKCVFAHVMKTTTLIILFAAFQMLAADDTNLVASGDWSQPVATQYGPAIQGRLLICDTPNHASSDPRLDTAVYLELQEFSGALRSVRVYCGLHRLELPDDAPGLRCELRDSKGKLVPNSSGGFSGSEPGSCWVTLNPYCSARMRVSVYGGGRLDDGGLAIYLASRGWWDVHPNPTNEYYLSGTFTFSGMRKRDSKTGLPVILDLNTGLPLEGKQGTPDFNDSTNMDVWSGTLTLPPVKIPVKKP